MSTSRVLCATTINIQGAILNIPEGQVLIDFPFSYVKPKMVLTSKRHQARVITKTTLPTASNYQQLVAWVCQ
jgi:hypothetical protein